MSMKAVYPRTLGWVEKKLNTKEMEYLWRCIDNKKGSAKKDLAGQIKESDYLIDKSGWFFTNTLTPLMSYYDEEFGNRGNRFPTTNIHPYYLDKMWVNYQLENEFNPIHDHNGIYSFVIWMKIPTDFKEQNSNVTNNQCISAFEFYFLNMLGERDSHRYLLGPSDEGKMLFFPSQLAHCVYPFYNCKEERISISGNIAINTTRLT